MAAVKASVLERCPGASLVDITHTVEPFRVPEAAFVLWAAQDNFPAGSVFVCVVDPGVGSARRALCATDGRHIFVAPDNGILTRVLEAARASSRPVELFELSNPDWRSRTVSPTFHGRDIFAPAAGVLAAGAEPGAAGAELADCVLLPPPRKEVLGPEGWNTEVLYVDRFGNLFLNLRASDLSAEARGAMQLDLRLRVGDVWMTGRLERTFSDQPPGRPVFYWGSTGYLEVALNQGNAAARWNALVGTQVELWISASTRN